MVQKKNFFGDNLAEEKLNIVLSLISDVFFEYDVKHDIVKFNDNNKGLGRKRKGFRDYIITSDYIYEEDKEAFLEFLCTKTPTKFEFRHMDEAGNLVWYYAKTHVILDKIGKPSTLIGCIDSLDKLGEENVKLVNDTEYDSLTKLYNRDALQLKIDYFLKMEGKKSKHALLIIDIDNFKVVNHNLGRLFGDTVLKNIADELKKLFYSTGYVGRIGGDEFLVFLKNITGDTLDEKVNQITKLCKDTYTGEMEENHITASIGISTYPSIGKDFKQLFKNADKALNKVKNRGKNDIEYFNLTTEYLCPKNSEYFNLYQVDEISNYSFSNFNKEITTFTFDIMANTKDVSSAIKIVLDKVGKHFGVSHVVILENSNDEKKLNLTYQWSEEENQCNLDSYFGIELKDYKDNIALFDERGIFFISDYTKKGKEDGYKKTFFEKLGVKSFLQCGIFEEGIFRGCISLDDCNETRVWSESEVESLFTITKILTSYLLKIRTSERINERLERIRNFDELTGLPTFHKFKKDACEIIKHNTKKQYAIVYSDISNFRYINDKLSYRTGDEVLCSFAKLVSQSLKGKEIVARISADNFMALVEYQNEERLIQRVESMNEKFAKEWRAKKINLNVVIISGACIINQNDDILSAIDNANIARKNVKTSSKTICKIYDNEMFEKISKEIEISNSMEEALANREFSIYLQPKINLADEKLVGAEALVRWIKPDGTIITPDDFIPQFEKNGFIINLDFFVYEEVCKTLKRWVDLGITSIPISVNVSRVHLDEGNFVEKFSKLVNKYRIAPTLLELELTETIFLDHTELAINAMSELRSLGFRVSIDDFGAGYSSLNLLKDMQTDVIKLDKEFFGKGEMRREEKVIVSNIINMAKQLNMKVLSEGVETKMQSDFLREMSCDMAQGYFYARPMPIKEFEKMIQEKQFKL